MTLDHALSLLPAGASSVVLGRATTYRADLPGGDIYVAGVDDLRLVRQPDGSVALQPIYATVPLSQTYYSSTGGYAELLTDSCASSQQWNSSPFYWSKTVALFGSPSLPDCGNLLGTSCWQPYSDAIDACQASYQGSWPALNCCTARANHDLKTCAATQLGCNTAYEDSDPTIYGCNPDWSNP